MAEYNCKFFPSSLKSHVPSFPAPDVVSIHLHIPSASSPTCLSALQLAEITLFVMITDYIGSKPHLTDGGIPVVLWWPPGIWAGELCFTLSSLALVSWLSHCPTLWIPPARCSHLLHLSMLRKQLLLIYLPPNSPMGIVDSRLLLTYTLRVCVMMWIRM